MAEKVGSVYIEIQAKMGSLEKDLKSLEDKLNGVNKKGNEASSTFSNMGKLIGGSLITGAIIGLGTAALKASANMEQQKVAFTTMLGSADKANKLLQEMTAFAASTPFQLNDIVAGGKSLLAFGFTAEEIIPTMTKLGDVSAALSIPIGELSDIYGKMKVQGVIQAEELNQLAGRGIPVFTELAKVMGVNSTQVKKLGSEGKITFKELEQAFTNMTKEGSQFGGLMAAQSKTLAGQWSNFNDAIDKTLTMLGDEMSPTAKAILTTMNSILQNYNDQTAEQKRLKDAEIERLKANGEINAAYILQNGLIGTGLNILNGTAESEVKIQGIKQDQEKTELLLKAHHSGVNVLTKDQLAFLEANSIELERQDKILKGTNDGWVKQNQSYKTLNDFLTAANKSQEESEKKTDRNAATWKKMVDEAKRFSETLSKQASATNKATGESPAVAAINEELIAMDMAEKKTKEDHAKGLTSEKTYQDELLNIATIRIDAERRKEEELQKAKIEAYNATTNVALSIGSQLAQLSQMSASNKTAEIDSELTKDQEALQAKYDLEVEAVNNSLLTETEKAAALKALDEQKARDDKALTDKAAKEKRKIAREAAKQQKVLSLFEVALQTPQAAMGAYTSLISTPFVGPIIAPIAAAAALAFGIAKAKLISEQPLPALAEGGIVPAVPGGNQFTIGEAGSSEAVIPLNDATLGRLATMINKAGGSSGQTIQVVVNLDGTVIYSDLYKATKDGRATISQRAVVA